MEPGAGVLDPEALAEELVGGLMAKGPPTCAGKLPVRETLWVALGAKGLLVSKVTAWPLPERTR